MVHDVVIQKLPVRMILDRAGLVGNDGPTHHGTFDLTYMGCLPDVVIMAPSDEVELMNGDMVALLMDEGADEDETTVEGVFVYRVTLVENKKPPGAGFWPFW